MSRPAATPAPHSLRAIVTTLGLLAAGACGGGGGGAYGSGGPGGGTPDAAPAFTGQPTAVTVTAGQNASFSAPASGSPAPTEQWERSADGSAWNPIPGATGSSYAFTAGKVDNGARFRARASNASGNATSDPALLTVQWPPTITAQPTNQTVNSPDSASFAIQLDANPAATCQWQSSADGVAWQDLAGATASTFSTGPTSGAMNGLRYRCVCSNALGSATSVAASLVVDSPSYALTVQLGAGCAGNPAVGASYALGAVVPYAYTAMAGYRNLQVLLDGAVAPASGSLTMNGAHTLAVSAAAIPQHTVTFLADPGGSLTGSSPQSVAEGGSTSPVTAVAGPGYAFVNWTGSGFSTSTANPLTIDNLTQDLVITAHFASTGTTYTITASAGVYGTIQPTGAVSVPAGGNKTFTISADPYYAIADVLVDGVSQGAMSSYTFSNVSANHTISATFSYVGTGY